MMKKNQAYRLLTAICALSFIACVDNDFRLDETSLEVTVGGEKTVLPLGYLEQTTLADLLENVDEESLEWLKTDENGNYSLQFVGDEESLEVEGINNNITVPEMSNTFYAQYPELDIIAADYTVDETFEVSVFHGDNLLDGTTVPIAAGITLTGIEEGKLTHNVSYDVPEQVSSIQTIYFGDGTHPYGSLIEVRFKLNELNGINAGGHVSVELRAPEGYVLRDKNGNELPNNTFSHEEVDFAADQPEVLFETYLSSVSVDGELDNHALNVPVELEYHLSFEMLTHAGTVNFSTLPELHVGADLTVKDADLVLNDSTIIEPTTSEEAAEDITVSGLPAELKTINALDFVDGNAMHFTASGYSWLSDAAAESVAITAYFPDMFRLTSGDNYEVAGNEITTNLRALRDGLYIGFDAMEFGAEGCEVVDGEIGLAFRPEVEVAFKKDAVVKLSELAGEGVSNLVIKTSIDALSLSINAVNGIIDYAYEQNEEILLDGIDEELELEILGTGLAPVITIDLTNPLTMSAIVSAELTPKKDGVALENNRIELNDVHIAAATVENGEVVGGKMSVVIADESLRDKYDEPQYTFVACDVTKLIEGSLPDALDFKVSLQTDSSKVQTLYIEPKYVVTYGYAVDIPLAFDTELGVRYADTVDGLGETMEAVADAPDITVGDIALLIKTTNTTPLNFAADVELLDASGNATAVQAVLPEEFILCGSKDGVAEACSEVRLALDVPNGDVKAVADIEAIRFVLDASGAADELVSLNANQYVKVDIQLEVKGGITVDFGNLGDL